MSPRRPATARATELLPLPAGPSIATSTFLPTILPARNTPEGSQEIRVGDGSRFGVVDLDPIPGGQPGHSQPHPDAVVSPAARPSSPYPPFRVPHNREPVRPFFDLDAYPSKLLADCPDPVRLFDAKLLGPPHYRLPYGEGPQKRQKRQLVHGARHIIRAHRSRLQRRVTHHDPPDRLADSILARVAYLHVRTHPAKYIQEPRPSGIEPSLVDPHLAARHHECRRNPERRRREISGHLDHSRNPQHPRRLDRHPPHPGSRLLNPHLNPTCFEQTFGVVPAPARLSNDHCPTGEEPGEEDTTLYLSTRSRQPVPRPPHPPAVAQDRDRQPLPILYTPYLRPHLP